MNDWETAALILHATAPIAQAVAGALDTAAAVAHAIPTVEAGAAGFGGTPSVNVKIGGPNVGHAAQGRGSGREGQAQPGPSSPRQ